VKKNTELEKVGRDTSRTLGMTAHDLRNPISGILNASEYLLGDADSSQRVTHFLHPRIWPGLARRRRWRGFT